MSNEVFNENSSPVLSQSQVERLRLPFPDEALSADFSRGFELTSIKEAFIIERLNQMFGLCGLGWLAVGLVRPFTVNSRHHQSGCRDQVGMPSLINGGSCFGVQITTTAGI